jgi:hypothetical protein
MMRAKTTGIPRPSERPSVRPKLPFAKNNKEKMIS